MNIISYLSFIRFSTHLRPRVIIYHRKAQAQVFLIIYKIKLRIFYYFFLKFD